MDTSKHDFPNLFKQLGLPASSSEVEAFLKTHRLQPDQQLEDAAFWSESQVQFIREARLSDADWSELIDELDARLRT